MRDLFELAIRKILISATVRNEQTLEAFTLACGEWRELDYSIRDSKALTKEQRRMALLLSNSMYLCPRKRIR